METLTLVGGVFLMLAGIWVVAHLIVGFIVWFFDRFLGIEIRDEEY